MANRETLGTIDEKIFCNYCRNILIDVTEKKQEYHTSCNQEIAKYKENLGYWYYLEMVQASIEDCTFDEEGNLIKLNLVGKGLLDLPNLPFKHLQQLDLSHNYLNRVPDWIFQLPRLNTIIFPGNGFSETLLLGILRLNQHGVNVISTGCTFNRKNRLIKLNLSYLGPIAPAELSEEITNYFTQVEKVNLARNGLAYLPDWVFQLTHLKSLNLEDNRIQSIPQMRFQSKKIEKLNLSNNYLKSIPDWIFELTHLKELNLARNRIRSLPEPERLIHMPNLKRIDLSLNGVSTDLMDAKLKLEHQSIAVTLY